MAALNLATIPASRKPAASVTELFEGGRDADRIADTPAANMGELALKLRLLAQCCPASLDALVLSALSDAMRADPDLPIPGGRSHPKHHCPNPWPHLTAT